MGKNPKYASDAASAEQHIANYTINWVADLQK